jgi:hypothetical protein
MEQITELRYLWGGKKIHAEWFYDEEDDVIYRSNDGGDMEKFFGGLDLYNILSEKVEKKEYYSMQAHMRDFYDYLKNRYDNG